MEGSLLEKRRTETELPFPHPPPARTAGRGWAGHEPLRPYPPPSAGAASWKEYSPMAKLLVNVRSFLYKIC